MTGCSPRSSSYSTLWSSRRITWAGLALLVVLAVYTRLSSLDYLLPHRPEPDAGMVLQAKILARGEQWASTERKLNKYPLLVPALSTLVPAPGTDGNSTLESHLDTAVHPFVRVRTIVAILGACAVPATFLLARAFFPPNWALLAAAWMLVNLLSLVFAGQARGHGAVGALSLLAVLLALRLRRRPNPASYVLAGLAAGAAVASLHNGVAVLIPLVLAHFTRSREPRRTPWWYALIPIVIVAAAVLYFYAPLLRGFTQLNLDQAKLQQGGHRVSLADFNGGGFSAIVRSFWWHDPALLVLAGLQLALLLGSIRRASFAKWWRGDLALVLAFAVPYVLVTGAFKDTYARFLTPLTPFLCLLAVGATARLARWAGQLSTHRGATPLATVLCVTAGLAWPAYAALRLVALRSAPDTFEATARWIEAHVDPDEETILVSTQVGLPLLYDPEHLPQKITNAWVRYQREQRIERAGEHVYTISEVPWSWQGKLLLRDREAIDEFLVQTDPDYVVVQVDASRLDRSEGRLFHRAVQDWGTRVARIPDAPHTVGEIALEYQDMPGLAWRVSGERALGPAIEIYRRER